MVLEGQCHIRQAEVAVLAGTAVSGKMFEGRNDTETTVLFNKDRSPGGNVLRIRRERPFQGADDRVVRVEVEVHHRRQVEVESQAAELPAQPPVLGPALLQVGLPHVLGAGHVYESVFGFEPVDPPTFRIHRHQQRDRGRGLQALDQ